MFLVFPKIMESKLKVNQLNQKKKQTKTHPTLDTLKFTNLPSNSEQTVK